VKYGGGRPVDVRVALAGRARVRLSVKDRGIGMSADEIAHAFVRFWRADKSGHTPGTGLGLALVKEIAELHDGRALLESGGANQGTTAIIELPVLTGRAALAA
jgi:signal transduction histidine kinase